MCLNIALVCVLLISAFFFLFVNDSSSLQEYEEKAVSFALNRPKLQELTNRLKAARLTCPLFDTARWVRTSVLFLLLHYILLFVHMGWVDKEAGKRFLYVEFSVM